MTIWRHATIALVLFSALAASSAQAETPAGPLQGPSEMPAGQAAPVGQAKAAQRHMARKKHVATRRKNEPLKNEAGRDGAGRDEAGVNESAGRPANSDGPVPTSTADHRAPVNGNDPLSLGMKWNGANDDASKTRVQNYNGDAEGTGAEVGLKLHF